MKTALPTAVLAALVALSQTFVSPTAALFAQDFVAVDTAVLMGSPDPLPPLEVERVFPELRFSFPVELTHAGDGSDRIFVVSQDGFIYVFENREDVTEKKTFLDITHLVAREKFEEGLLGLAFHPKYRENGEFFVYYSVKPLATRISRFRVSKDDPDRADPESEEVLLQVAQPFWNHNGGSLNFGPDGYLYVGLGDGGAANDPHGNGQNLKTLLGSILRIDVDHRDPGLAYAVPKDNPFVDRGAAARPEIWALGIRNPWKLCFDRETGALWEADVGQNLWEEVNIIVKGGNYGWNAREGLHPFDPKTTPVSTAIDPVWEYHHSEGRSITGGSVYRGKRLPEIYGWYLCADWVSGKFWALEWDGTKVRQALVVAKDGYTVAAFGEDEAGETYFTAFDGAAPVGVQGTIYGGVYRLRRAEKAPNYAKFPSKLSSTGLFASVKDHVPTAGLIPYSVNVPLWSDHAGKDRFLALPSAGNVKYSETESWDFPVGTVAVKTFHMDMTRGDANSRRRLETRLMVHNPRGWDGYTYVWNEEQTDATLLRGSLERTYRVQTDNGEVEQRWYFPSHSDCNACHTKMRKHVLGLNTRQIKRPAGDLQGSNQLAALDRLGIFTSRLDGATDAHVSYPAWDDTKASTRELARAYLDVNCSICHVPGGTGLSVVDLRYQTPLTETKLLGRGPTIRRLGPEGAQLVTPGNPEASEILYRLAHRGKGQMPPLATNAPDAKAQEIVRRWIDGLAGK
jgi:uncharacterized repeat protein (TIGR03806 family)